MRRPPARRWIRPKVEFLLDGVPTFTPAPPGHVLPIFEWGLNWTIGCWANQYLIIHAAVVERNGRAMIMPGQPGAGKSTLCAALIHRGWRLLSDEFALIVPKAMQIVPLGRPISLKNESIALLRDFAPEISLSEPVEGTTKGTVALARPPDDCFRKINIHADPGLIVFPNYQAGAAPKLSRRRKAETFIELAANSINYGVWGREGFDVLSQLVTLCSCFDFTYSDLQQGVGRLSELADGVAPPACGPVALE